MGNGVHVATGEYIGGLWHASTLDWNGLLQLAVRVAVVCFTPNARGFSAHKVPCQMDCVAAMLLRSIVCLCEW